MFEGRKIPEEIQIYEIAEPVSFGALPRYDTVMRLVEKIPKGRVLILRKVRLLDESGFHLLKNSCEWCYRKNIKLVLVGVQPKPLSLIKKDGLYDLIGPMNIVDTVQQALKRFERIG
jgi:MFS superfamily sulfate permease-like transporter